MRLAMMHTGWQLALRNTSAAQVTLLRWYGNIGILPLVFTYLPRANLGNLYPILVYWKVVLYLASNLAGETTRAVLIVY